MGQSSSSLLDENKTNYIIGHVEAKLKEFSPYYRKQYSVASCSQIQEEMEQHKEGRTQLLKQRNPPDAEEILYKENVLHFDEVRKWKERVMVVRADYSLECHESNETFMKGMPPRYKLLPTGGTVLTTNEDYMVMVDKCFPDSTDSNSTKEEFGPAVSGLPGQFPAYLRLPYQQDSYFCFQNEKLRADFISVLSNCIRHQNQDFLKKKTCDVRAFLKAIQLYRQDKGNYDSWDMLIGSDVRVLANLITEEMLPSMQKDLFARLKAKKTERKRVWFATVEEVYALVQERLMDGLSALKTECQREAQRQEGRIRSDMDQILGNRTFVEGKLRAMVTDPAEKIHSEHVRPHLASTLEELMGPISSGFQEARQLSDNQMNQLCQDFQKNGANEDLKTALVKLGKPNLLSCYQQINSLHEELHNPQKCFGFSNIRSLVDSTQIDLQQLVENAAYTFELLLNRALKDHPDTAGSAVENAMHRVLKQYDHDSSTVRKKIFQEALVEITLPTIKKNLASVCKPELQKFDDYIFSDYTDFVAVENIYEDILLNTLERDITTVVKEAASLKKHNLFSENRDMVSQSSLFIPTPPESSPNSPALVSGLHAHQPQPPSPLLGQSVPESQAHGDASSSVKTNGDKRDLKQNKMEDGPTTAEKDEVFAASVAEDVKEREKMITISVSDTTLEKVPVDTPVAMEAPKGDTPTPTQTVIVDTHAPPEAKTPDEPIPIQTNTADQHIPTEMVNTSIPIEAGIVDTPTPIEKVPAETPIPMGAAMDNKSEAVKVDTPFPAEAAKVNAELPAETQTVITTSAETLIDEMASSSHTNTLRATAMWAAGKADAPVRAEPEMPGPSNTMRQQAETEPGSECHLRPITGDQEGTKTQTSTASSGDENVTGGTSAERIEEHGIFCLAGEESRVTSNSTAEVSASGHLTEAKQSPARLSASPDLGVSANANTLTVAIDDVRSQPTKPGSSRDGYSAEEATLSGEQAKAPAVDSVKEIRDLVVEVIEVEEIIKPCPDPSV